MVVYVEYVLIENFALDLMLLYLAFRGSKVNFTWKGMLLSAFLGALFALFFPLLSLPVFWAQTLNFCFGFLLCLLPFKGLKNKNAWSRYALTCLIFFALSFAFAGGIFALYNGSFTEEDGRYYSERPALLPILCLSVFFFVFVCSAVKKLYQRRALHRHIYDCTIVYNKRRLAVLGFLDSGNLASKNGVPVCFVSPDVAYDIWQNELAFSSDDIGAKDDKTRGQVCDQIVISTLGGEKTLPLYKGGLEIKTERGVIIKNEVYFAPSTNIISREYKLLLQSCVLNENA